VRVVVDTNVLVSGLISQVGAPAAIIDAILDQRVIPVFSKATHDELRSVLARPKFAHYFARSRFTVRGFLADLAAVAEFVQPRSAAVGIRDPKDQPFLELFATLPTADFFITGDKDFERGRYHGVRVVSPTEFQRLALRKSK
jgi:putative PIN family toxin of toxin-antitoxin system